MEKGLISVIIPVYNAKKWLMQCINSVQNQTYKKLEIIIVNDGSTDGSGDLCDNLAASDNRIKVFHRKNSGVAATRNFALDKANGEWIAFIDSDDWIEPEMYSKLLEAAEKYAVSVVSCGSYNEYANGPLPGSKAIFSDIELNGTKDVAKAFFSEGLFRDMIWDKLYSCAFFNEFRFPKRNNYEDWAVITKLIRDDIRMVCIPEYCYHYRKVEKGLTHKRKLVVGIDYWKAARERETVKPYLK